MVGVPGKSKACQTCRKRRAKCDMAQPRCSQCKRRGLPCGGYSRPFIFINNTSQEVQTGSFKFEKTSYSVPEEERRIKPLSISTHELARGASEEGLIGYFWSTYLPNGRAASDEVNQYSLYGWTNVVQELYPKNEMIRVALLAGALSRAGQLQNDAKMLQKSHEFYGRTLIAVGKAIRQQSKQPLHATLAALKLLNFYELWSGPDQFSSADHFKAWSAHIQGSTAYLMHKDPRTVQQGHAHQLFSDSRLAQAVIGLGTRKATPLAQEAWKTIPWRKIKKTPKDELIDIMVDIPGIYEEAEKIQSSPAETQQLARSNLVTKCWLLSRDLRLWTENAGKAAVEFAEEKLRASYSENEYPPSSEDLAKGLLVIMYWSCCIMIYDTIHSETSRLPPSETKIDPPTHSDPVLYCRKMANLVPHFVTSNSGEFFIHKVIASIGFALRYLVREEGDSPSEEKLQLRKAFKGQMGQRAAEILQSFQISTGGRGRPFFE